jgi:hypothetical protein
MRRSCHTEGHCRERSTPRDLALTLAAVSLLTIAPSAWAGPSDVAVRIRCPVLSDVAAAEFEARAKVDLSARSTSGGELEVVCDDSATRLRWRQKGGAWWARSLPPAAAPAAFVDGLLRASEELVEESLRFEGSEAASKDQPAPPEGAASSDETSDSEITGAPAGSPNPPPKAPPPDDTATTEPSRDDAPRPPSDPSKWSGGIAAGADAALFFGGAAIVGPRVGLFAGLPGGWVIQLMGEYDFGLGAGNDVTVGMAGGSGVIAKRFGRADAFEVGVGPVVGSVFASTSGVVQPPSLAELFAGVLVRGRYGLRAGEWRFSMGPELRVHGIRPEIAVDHVVVWAVPPVSVGLGIEVSLELIGSH